MRFFTPELYRRFNSSDEAVADEASEAWETALAEYRRHLADVRDRMPSSMRKLTDVCLHDAELLSCEQVVEPFFPFPLEFFGPPPFWSALAIVSLRQGETIVSLFYLLWDRVRDHAPGADWPFSKERIHWLYDEVDVAPNAHGRFLHRVLWSDGRVLEIPFLSVVIHRPPLTLPRNSAVIRLGE